MKTYQQMKLLVLFCILAICTVVSSEYESTVIPMYTRYAGIIVHDIRIPMNDDIYSMLNHLSSHYKVSFVMDGQDRQDQLQKVRANKYIKGIAYDERYQSEVQEYLRLRPYELDSYILIQ
jgi:hypothetical protein